jgi:predicted nucleic acid-binding protein
VIVLDTNVLSEASKPSSSGAVLRWLDAQEPLSVFTTAVTQAEMLLGIAVLPPGRRRTRFLREAERMFAEDFGGRILPFDESAARLFATIAAARKALGRPISQSDAMIAAITRTHGAALATRNTADFEHCGLRIVNPWAE